MAPTTPPPPDSINIRRVVSLNPDDVLLGRGRGPSKFIGNKRFLELVKRRKDDYTSNESYKGKAIIAHEVFQEITSRGGRFLHLIKSGKPARNVIEDGEWYQVEKAEALEKCKQALREIRETKPVTERNGEKIRRNVRGENQNQALHRRGIAKVKTSHSAPKVATVLLPSASSSSGGLSGDVPRESAASVKGVVPEDEKKRAPTLRTKGQVKKKRAGNVETKALSTSEPSRTPDGQSRLGINDATTTLAMAPCAQYALDLLTCQRLFLDSQPPKMMQHPMAMSPLFNHHLHPGYLLHNSFMAPWDASNTYPPTRMPQEVATCANSLPLGVLPDPSQRYVGDSVLNSRQQTILNKHTDSTAPLSCDTSTVGTAKSFEVKSSIPAADKEAALFTLSALAVAGRPTFTEQQEQLERATMTNEERAAALFDLFGKYCNINCPENKRARGDLDRALVEFLINQMKMELEQIPASKKQALLEAQAKCEAFEFSDKRLERFLRCAGMNVKVRCMFGIHHTYCRNRNAHMPSVCTICYF